MPKDSSHGSVVINAYFGYIWIIITRKVYYWKVLSGMLQEKLLWYRINIK